jgi:hypothetical protein
MRLVLLSIMEATMFLQFMPHWSLGAGIPYRGVESEK